MSEEAIEQYLRRHGLPDETNVSRVEGLRACVVIPAKAERHNLPEVLESLEPIPRWAEVIVVVNQGPDSSPEVHRNNEETMVWLEKIPKVVAIDRFGAGREITEGGVGHARRVGMDTALARLRASGADQGIIACLDADSPVEPGYLNTLDVFFSTRPEVLAGVCHFEHRPATNPALDDAIVEYETWLRYWEEGLHAACSPYAFQNVGSCMVASAQGYAAVDGMPQLSSAQDFYFLEKVVKHGGPGAVRTIADAVVRPSARPSRRVPHGTGRALADILDGNADKYRLVPPASVFFDLRELSMAVDELFEGDEVLERLDASLRDFLERRCGGRTTIASMRDTAPDSDRFERQFWAWFSASRQIQYANEVAAVRGAVHPAAACHDLLHQDATPGVPVTLADEASRGRTLLAELRRRSVDRARDEGLDA